LYSILFADEELHRIVGVFVVNNGFDVYSSYDKLTTVNQFLQNIEREAKKRKLALSEQGNCVNLWLLGVHPDYRGNKIANNLVKGVLPLCKKAGFKYAVAEATSFFTSKVVALNDFEEVYSINAKDWEWKGESVFTNIKAPHGKCTFWVKDLVTV